MVALFVPADLLVGQLLSIIILQNLSIISLNFKHSAPIYLNLAFWPLK